MPSTAPAPADVPKVDAARVFYPLDETGGSTVRDVVSNRSLAVGSRAYLGQAGVPNLPGTAVRLDGRSGGALADQSNEWGRKLASVELWFNTTTNSGGYLAGLGNSRSTTGTSSTIDRILYMTNDGRITFGVSSDIRRTITSGPGLNNGQWHHVVATIDSLVGTTLYVDGVAVGTEPDANSIAGSTATGGSAVTP